VLFGESLVFWHQWSRRAAAHAEAARFIQMQQSARFARAQVAWIADAYMSDHPGMLRSDFRQFDHPIQLRACAYR